MKGYCVHCRIWSDHLDRCRWCPECQRELADGRRWYWQAIPRLTERLQCTTR